MHREATFVYFFKTDKKQETIGSVMAFSKKEAITKIAIIKQLPEVEIDRLFIVKLKRGKYENDL
ncbi:MAG: hypothetical protein EBT26_07595 [Microbacteriaceae bacterium]|nr:hypothetical protein [Microbacteriaceae bacterium]